MAWDKQLTQHKLERIDELMSVMVEFIKALNEKPGARLSGPAFKGVKFPDHNYRDSFCRISSLKYTRKTLFHFNVDQLDVLTPKDVWEIWDRGYKGCAMYLQKNGDKIEKVKGDYALMS